MYQTILNGVTVDVSSFFSISDIDECVTDTHGCSQGCTNTEGSFVCSCPPGYLIQEDGANCGGRWVDGCTRGP